MGQCQGTPCKPTATPDRKTADPAPETDVHSAGNQAALEAAAAHNQSLGFGASSAARLRQAVGLDDGPLDEGFSGALATFQAEEGVGSDGVLDEQTMWQLPVEGTKSTGDIRGWYRGKSARTLYDDRKYPERRDTMVDAMDLDAAEAPFKDHALDPTEAFAQRAVQWQIWQRLALTPDGLLGTSALVSVGIDPAGSNYASWNAEDLAKHEADPTLVQVFEDDTFLTRALEVVTVDGTAKRFGDVTGDDGVAFGIAHFTNPSDLREFFEECMKVDEEGFLRAFYGADIADKSKEELYAELGIAKAEGENDDNAALAAIASSDHRQAFLELFGDPRWKQVQLDWWSRKYVARAEKRAGRIAGEDNITVGTAALCITAGNSSGGTFSSAHLEEVEALAGGQREKQRTLIEHYAASKSDNPGEEETSRLYALGLFASHVGGSDTTYTWAEARKKALESHPGEDISSGPPHRPKRIKLLLEKFADVWDESYLGANHDKGGSGDDVGGPQLASTAMDLSVPEPSGDSALAVEEVEESPKPERVVFDFSEEEVGTFVIEVDEEEEAPAELDGVRTPAEAEQVQSVIAVTPVEEVEHEELARAQAEATDELTLKAGTGETGLPARVAGPLEDEAVIHALDELAERAWEPKWILLLQNVLGVPADSCTAAWNRATVQAIAQWQVDRGSSKPDGYITPTSGDCGRLQDEFAVLQTLSPAADTEFSGADRPGDDLAEEDRADKSKMVVERAVIDEGWARSWDDFTGQWRKTTFLGQRVEGHPVLLERLDIARKALELRFPGADDKALGEELGVTRLSGPRAPKGERGTGGLHTMGMAFDINAADNPWILGQNGREIANDKTIAILERACAFTGRGEAFDLGKLASLNETMDTTELYVFLEDANQALITYRTLAGDREGIATHLASASPEVAALGVDHWLEQITDDDNSLDYDWLQENGQNEDRSERRKESNWDARTDNKGFMTYKQELIEALRGSAGLNWGGCDLGNDSGDMMHFDARTDDDVKSLKSRAYTYKKETG